MYDVVIEPPLQPLSYSRECYPMLTGKMMLELIYMLVGSGVAGKVPFFM